MRYLIALSALALGLPAYAQHYPAFTIADSLKEGANAVIRDYQVAFEMRSEKKGWWSVEKTVTLFNGKSGENKLAIGYDDGTRVRKIEVKLYDALGRELRAVDKDEIKDYAAVSGGTLYGDRRIKQLEVRHSTYPYTITYRYEQELEGIDYAAGQEWYPQRFNTSVEQARFTFTAPEGFPVNYKAYHFHGQVRSAETDDGLGRTWSVRNLKALPFEAYSPPAEALLPRIVCVPGRINIDGYEGAFSSWESFSRYIHSLWEGRGELPDHIKAEVRREVADAVSEEDKIARLYQYLQQNMRYVSVQLGIGGWQPFDADYVAKNKYGDCKALTNYMQAILKEVGIEAYPALIYAASVPVSLDTSLVRSQFNHVLLYLPNQDDWLECTSSTNPAQYISYGNHNRKVLLVKQEEGGLMSTPHLGYLENIRSAKTTVVLNDKGQAQLTQHSRMVAKDAQWWRALKLYYSEEELKETAQEELLPAPGVSLASVHIQPEVKAPSCQVRLKGQSGRYASRAGNRLFVPLLPVGSVGEAPPDDEDRHWPVKIQTGFTYRDTVIHHLPEGFQVESMMEEMVTLDHPTGYYQLKAEQQQGKILVVRVLQRRMAELPPAGYEEFRTFWLEVGKLERSMAVLVQKRT